MTASIIDILKENARQGLTGDDSFYKNDLYYFKLNVPMGKGPTAAGGAGLGNTSVLFPLPLSPETMETDLPFACETTPTQDGGTVSEEGGIVIGRIAIQATTGWKLKKSKDTSTGSGDGTFTGQLPKASGGSGQELSGQMLLWRLMGRCFDAYSACKKDPEAAHKTTMEFHCLKDQLHYLVKPKRVSIKRGGVHRVTYGYSIEMEIVGSADLPSAIDKTLLDDGQDLLDEITDTIYTARKYVQATAATVDDLTACVGEMGRYISNIADIITDVQRITDATSDFLDGVKTFVDIPATFISRVTGLVDSAIDVGDTWDDFPSAGKRALKELEDELDGLAVASRGSYRDQFDEKARSYVERIQRQTSLSSADLSEAQTTFETADSAAGTMSMDAVFNSKYRPGDYRRSQAEPSTPTVQEGEFGGWTEVTIGQGDTIHSLAMRHMGDSDKWKAVAMVNNLRPPYISADRVRKPFTKKVGDPLLIPISNPQESIKVFATGNPEAGASQADAVMGRDFRLERLPSGKYTIAVDTAHGSVDAQKVWGVKNLVQGLEKRCRTEQRTNPHRPNMGLPRVGNTLGSGQSYVEARMMMDAQLRSDPRISRVERFTFDLDGDTLTMITHAVPVGYDTSRPIPVTLT